ncbi:uncharacterized protein LOC130821343 isoform X2 [Amaranthus tricolor]|uniref:uncharacterized protein LOC130821343 isoform X2 n=1 Tax=Amaranthus tricolor TaxID=29722 RepID=UPI00258A71A1|nr:uncharacterized protein LOC130821343 isoform X2 [Amaranthus tricolor]
MAQLFLQGRLKLILNGENPVQCKLIGGNRTNGLLGFADLCSIFPSSINDHNVRRNAYSRKGIFIASAKVNVVCWKRAICLEFMDKADVLEYYDQTVNSPNGSFNIPAVLRVRHLLQVMKRKRVRNTLSRKNIFYRDDYMCQYCKSTNNLTIDHVIPVSQGGEWEWENLVTACAKCNSKKGHKTLEEVHMSLVKSPKAPKDYDILAIPLTSAAVRMLKIRKGTPEEWRQYLPN